MELVQGTVHNIRRGEVYEVKLGEGSGDASLVRPVLVIQNDIGNSLYDSVIVVPLSPKVYAKRLFVSVGIMPTAIPALKEEHVALFFQIRTIHREKLIKDNFLGKVDAATMWQVDEAIKLSLGISTIQRIQSRKKA